MGVTLQKVREKELELETNVYNKTMDSHWDTFLLNDGENLLVNTAVPMFLK